MSRGGLRLVDLAAELSRIAGRPLAVLPASRLREDLGLGSLQLMQLAVWTYERFGVNLGAIAEQTGRRFDTAQDLLDVLPT
jgi:acyl carrier protein